MTDNWRDAERDHPPTDADVDRWVREEHARRYPDGCGETLKLCCEDCLARFAATLDRLNAGR